MKRLLLHLLAIGAMMVLLSSCRTSAPHYNYQELAKASIRLGMDIGMKDNHKLYVEAAQWIGVPYRGGGNSKRGTDCSALPLTYIKKYIAKSWNEVPTANAPKIAAKWRKGTCAKATSCFSTTGARSGKPAMWAST